MTFLAAVQSKLEPEAYKTSAGFVAWILEQTSKALQPRDPAVPALIAFPELIGLPLFFFLERNFLASSVQTAALELTKQHWFDGLKLGWQYPRLSSILLPRAVALHQTIVTAFAQAAREHNTYIVAGSSFLPFVDQEAAQGMFIANPKVQNVSFLFAPSSGHLLSRSAKVHLTRGLESNLGLSAARLEDWSATQTKIGQVGTLICYDAFFDSCIAKADAMGTRILVQPSANAAKWLGAWSADARLIEGQEWLARGAIAQIQGCEFIQAVINPMLVGKLFELEFEGCSSIGFNGSRASVFASNHTDFAVVSAQFGA
jgi:predicted amidohydrolase